METVPFSAIHSADLQVDAVYQGGRMGNAGAAVALFGNRHDRGVDDLATHRQIALILQVAIDARIKAGETPECWQDKPAKRRQKDVEARWTKKHGRSHYGYKNHVNVDRRHKLVRRYQVSDAATHDSKVLDDILDGDNTALGVWADSAYRSAEIEAALKKKGLRSRIHRKARRNKPLSEREKQGNKTRSSVRVRVEHVFGAQSNDMGGTLLRSVGLARAKARIGLKNLAYNMRRLVQLDRLAAAV